MNNENLLTAESISKAYNAETNGLSKVSLNIGYGEKIGVIGETGSGKSTLLKIMAGLLQSDTGSVSLNGEPLQQPKDQLIPGHPAIAYLSQHFELPKFINVTDFLEDRYLIANEVAQRIFRSCKIDTLMDRSTRELSGGEKQRVALAKLLTKSPKLLLLDEPFSNLDFAHKEVLSEVLDDVYKTFRTSMVQVTHNPLDILAWAQHVIVMKEGRINQSGQPQEVFERPKDTYTAGLLGPYNLVSKEIWEANGTRFQEIGSKILVRPNHFKMKNEKKGIPCLITKIYYKGDYEEIVAFSEFDQIIFHAVVGQYKVNQTVFLGFSR